MPEKDDDYLWVKEVVEGILKVFITHVWGQAIEAGRSREGLMHRDDEKEIEGKEREIQRIRRLMDRRMIQEQLSPRQR